MKDSNGSSQGYFSPFILSVLIHIILILCMILASLNWSKPQKPGSSGQQIINATMVDLVPWAEVSRQQQIRKNSENSSKRLKRRRAVLPNSRK